MAMLRDEMARSSKPAVDSEADFKPVQSSFEAAPTPAASEVVEKSSSSGASTATSSAPGSATDQLAEYRKQQAALRQQAKATSAAPAAASAKVTGGSGKVGGPKKTSPSAHQAPKPQKLPPNEKEKLLREAQDDDELLDAAIKLSGICHHPGCKENVKLIHSDCQYCLERFCMKHALAEIHGCGDKARAAARKETVTKAKEIKATGGQGIQGSGLKDWQRSSLQAKLHKKVEDQKSQRTRQPPKGKK